MTDWPDSDNEMLTTLWKEGHSTAEIGRRIGRSKNSVVGRAHRIGLEERPSPIRRAPGSYIKPPPSVPRPVGPTLPPLASYEPPPVIASAPPPAHLPAPRIMAPPVQAVRRRPSASCCWPIGEPGTKTFRFCDDPSTPGRPYCDEHAKLAYLRIRDRVEDAA